MVRRPQNKGATQLGPERDALSSSSFQAALGTQGKAMGLAASLSAAPVATTTSPGRGQPSLECSEVCLLRSMPENEAETLSKDPFPLQK